MTFSRKTRQRRVIVLDDDRAYNRGLGGRGELRSGVRGKGAAAGEDRAAASADGNDGVGSNTGDEIRNRGPE